VSNHRPDVRVPWWRQLIHALTDREPRSRIVDLSGQTVGLILFIVLTPGLVALGSDAVGQTYPAWLRVALVGGTLGGLALIGLYLRRPARK